MKFSRIFNSIAFRISVSIAVIVAATAMAVGWMILREELSAHKRDLKSKGRYLAELISHQIVEPILYEEKYEIFSLLKAPMKGKESLVVYAEVYDKNGEEIVTVYKDEEHKKNVLSHTLSDFAEKGEIDDPLIYHISVPVNISTFETIGFLRLGITKEFYLATLDKVKKKLYTLSFSIIFVGVVLGLLIARRIINPVLVLHKGVRSIEKGEMGVEVPIVGEGEIKELALSFNMMSAKLKELFSKIKTAQEQLVRTEKLYAVGEFSAGVAHEIKNPLTAIKMLMQNVKNRGKQLSVKDVEIIEEELNRIDRIVTEFLAFARPEKYELVDLNIDDVLDEVIALTGPKMEQSSIKLERLESPFLKYIKGSHDALKQVFLNLVLNAMQAMDGNGILQIKTVPNGKYLSVFIKDNGSGISEKDLAKVFDPFFTTKKEGTGMGLALTHNIVNDHSGSIDIKSATGEGTTVRVDFPLQENNR